MTRTIRISQPRVVLDDPHACTDSGDVLAVFGAVFDTLVRREPSGDYGPGLATAWTVSDDARRFTFTLREGVRFHDGEPCDAQAVRFCLERMARPDMGATLGAPGVYAQYLTGMQVETHGAHGLTVTLAEPIADLFDILAYGHVVSPKAIAGAGDDLARRAVGTGPYRLERYVPGETIELRAHGSHFDGPPAADRLVWTRGATAAERLDALRRGEADIANGLDPTAVQALPDEPGLAFVAYTAPTAIICMLNASRGPGRSAALRRALNLAVDREALIERVLGGAGVPLHGFVSPAHFGADPGAPPYQKDRREAARLLAEAGFGDGLTLEVYCPTRLPDEAQALVAQIEAQLADLGIRFEVHLEPDRTHYANQVRLKNIHDLCVFDSSPMSVFRVLHEKIDSRVRGSWWEGYANPRVEALLDEARRTVDRARREALFQQCYRLLQEDPPWIYLYCHRRTLGFRGADPAWTMRADGVLDMRRLPTLARDARP
ncbi:ABC transporter substrate-binding protein [Salinarimonas soli]|uniref:Peptide ABC transporter substrate-binding protein n=1 Tax=Salinarimonas soli TaxID=1638099 RepID=A0A5B2VCX3_9HYPH|nr:ABC transporter substrate-binding protein [Salinarimonas soli]KAA2236310.1 peptide ABC transporter substrate-binding protein [Salinarimonas soli]